MATNNLIQAQKVLSWSAIEERAIKFNGDEDPLGISDAVASFLQNTPIADDTLVNIQYSETPDGDYAGIVERISVVATENSETTKKEESKVENNYKINTLEFTVGGVSVAKRSLIFEEHQDAKIWHNLDEGLDAQEIRGMYKKKVKVEIEETEEGKNNIIKSIVLLEQKENAEPKESPNSFDNTQSYSSSTQKSIESQVAVEHAQILYGKLLSGLSAEIIISKKDEINLLIEERAKKNYDLIQELKKR